MATAGRRPSARTGATSPLIPAPRTCFPRAHKQTAQRTYLFETLASGYLQVVFRPPHLSQSPATGANRQERILAMVIRVAQGSVPTGASLSSLRPLRI